MGPRGQSRVRRSVGTLLELFVGALVQKKKVIPWEPSVNKKLSPI
jgi:hypothetical protein